MNNYPNSIHVYGSRLLPFDIYGVRDVYPAWGARYAHEIWGINPEYSVMFVQAKGVSFKTASISLAFPAEIEGFKFIPLLGADAHYYHGHTDKRELPNRFTVGYHLGVSPVLDIVDHVQFRVDFKMGFGPGQYLLINGGIAVSF